MVAVKGVSSPCVSIPGPILVGDDRYRHDHAPATHLVGSVDAILETAVWALSTIDALNLSGDRIIYFSRHAVARFKCTLHPGVNPH